ncbi:MAG: hypothetical protein K8R56_04655 [Candidatus Eisenbacteria bacterium]|nr:hypothetical protein [Candidatus Eisenbacteria bacterium]
MTHTAPVTRSNAARRGSRGSRARTALAALALLAALAPAALAAPAAGTHEQALIKLSGQYSVLLTRHRPDLAERYQLLLPRVPFVALDAASLPAHERTLRAMLDQAQALPASPAADSLRARLTAELADCAPGGALRTDALLWLDIVAAAARVPLTAGKLSACTRSHHAAQQLVRLPEALRGAAVLTSGHAPDPVAFESRISAVEHLLRRELPERTGACMETRRRAEFVEADSLAAASLAKFRRWVLPRH